MEKESQYMIRENVYGHKKRLNFIIKSIKDYCLKNSKSENSIRILDFGCGTGYMVTIPLASLGYNILGVDLDSESIGLANKINTFQRARFIVGDVESLKRSPLFDIIICSEVLEHLKKPEKLLETFHDILFEDGICIITVPNGYSWFDLEQYLWNRFSFENLIKRLGKYEIDIKKKYFKINVEGLVPKFPSTLSNAPHLQKFTLKKLKRLFSDKGFELAGFRKASIISGKISEFFLRGFDFFLRINNFLADILPNFCAIDWYFVLYKKKIVYKKNVD